MLDVTIEKRLGSFAVQATFVTAGAGVTALFGHSGAGKSSVIDMIAGLKRPDSGRILVGDCCVFDSAQRIDIPPEKRRFGYVFQEDRLFHHLTVQANLTYGMKRTPQKQRYIRFDAVVNLLGIRHLLHRRPATLSGGEKQRVAIGRALLTSPRLLLMDEPLASLDAARKAELLPYIGRFPNELKVPVLYVTHSVDEILNLADTLVFIEKGSTLAVGDVADITARPDFQKLAGRTEAGVVLATTVASHNDTQGITRLRFDGGEFCISRTNVPIGNPVRIRIHPRNVGIALDPIAGTSIQNVFPANVTDITDTNIGAPVDVWMTVGSQPLIATVTPKAALELDLKPGKAVYAMIKSVSISLGSAYSQCSIPYPG
ncbi:MAG: molybdenum ABC transporter ATP-binding protein [Myxococcota bacterium]|nr:molybdenum ABC transporter ATP-binding protein [Myxococcota bacterium]